MYSAPRAAAAILPIATIRRPSARAWANGSPAATSAGVGGRFELSVPGWVGTTFQSNT
jgi:hypothetical protein